MIYDFILSVLSVACLDLKYKTRACTRVFRIHFDVLTNFVYQVPAVFLSLLNQHYHNIIIMDEMQQS